jgi:glutamate-5-semialdehyde dehydrogenase
MNAMSQPADQDRSDIAGMMRAIGNQARAAASELARSTTVQKNDALRGAAAALRQQQAAILSANATDMKAAEA